jgi:hypothetical protein
MGKVGWIIVAVLLWLLFSDRIAGAVNSVTGRPRSPSDYYGAPPPGPGYYSSPPSSPNTSWTDVINNAVALGGNIYRTYSGGAAASPSSPGAIPSTDDSLANGYGV